MSKVFDPTKPVQTRDGRKARILAADIKGSSSPIVAAVLDRAGTDYEYVNQYQADGRYTNYTESPTDLVNVPERRTVYVNFYEGSNPETYYAGGVYPSREDADRNAWHAFRTACIRVEVEEGRFDE